MCLCVWDYTLLVLNAKVSLHYNHIFSFVCVCFKYECCVFLFTVETCLGLLLCSAENPDCLFLHVFFGSLIIFYWRGRHTCSTSTSHLDFTCYSFVEQGCICVVWSFAFYLLCVFTDLTQAVWFVLKWLCIFCKEKIFQ